MYTLDEKQRVSPRNPFDFRLTFLRNERHGTENQRMQTDGTNENFDLTLRWILGIVWNWHGVRKFIFLEEYLIYVEYIIILLVRIIPILYHVLFIHSRLINEVTRKSGIIVEKYK